MRRHTISQYKAAVDENAIDASEHVLMLFDFIDKEYGTTYNDITMNDEIERLEDERLKMKPGDAREFEIVEKMYDLACEKYPKVKEETTLNPRKRFVNAYFVFDKVFGTFLDVCEEEEHEKLKNDLISRYPKCKKLIEDMFGCDDEDEWDEKWFIPRDEILDEEYEKLYEEGMNYE